MTKTLVVKIKETPACWCWLMLISQAFWCYLRLDTSLIFVRGKVSLICYPLFNIEVTRLQCLNPLLFSPHILTRFDVFIFHLHKYAFAFSSSFYPVIQSYKLKYRLCTCTWQSWYIKKKNRTHYLCTLHSDSPRSWFDLLHEQGSHSTPLSPTYPSCNQPITKPCRLYLQNVSRMHSPLLFCIPTTEQAEVLTISCLNNFSSFPTFFLSLQSYSNSRANLCTTTNISLQCIFGQMAVVPKTLKAFPLIAG